MSPDAKKTPTWVVVLAWAVVAVPLGWGVIQTIDKARPLFAW